MSTNCSATCAACGESTFRLMSARTSRYQAKSSTSSYLSRAPMRRMVWRSSSFGQVLLANSISFLTASTKVGGVTISSSICRAIFRAVVSDSSMLCNTLAWRSGRLYFSFHPGSVKTSRNSSRPRYLRFRSEEFRKFCSFSTARTASAVPSGIVRIVVLIASYSTLWAFVVLRRLVRGSTIFEGSLGSSGQSSWKSFRSLMDSQLLVVFTRMW
mmetsp:Transcript_62702/g.183845  ORF Transcript_62702/g.183845 Transcript_62702/m.183845 type:complete len:213 (+) Transcript_62702:522-1160(+)